jgi:hypothetical protein
MREFSGTLRRGPCAFVRVRGTGCGAGGRGRIPWRGIGPAKLVHAIAVAATDKTYMQFLRHQRHVLLVLAVLLLASVMVVRQHLANESAHVGRVEDFILLHERGALELATHRYQRLVQELPDLSEAALARDLHRTAMLLNGSPGQVDNLIWKYRVGVENELKRRADRRLSHLLQETPAK